MLESPPSGGKVGPPMTIRDLGYRPYEGPRLPPTNNTWVMFRQGLRRAWGSWLVKIATFLSVGPVLVMAAYVVIVRYFVATMAAGEQPDPVAPASLLDTLFAVQFVAFVSMVTLGAGASAIAEDLTHRAFQFYFAKPVTSVQYLGGRVLAVGVWVFALTFVPAVALEIALVGTAPMVNEDASAAILEPLGLLVPSFALALIVATVMSTTSVALSSLSKSRALTMSAWLVLLVVPHIVALVVDAVARGSSRGEEGWPWLYLGSLYGLIGTISDALFKIDRDSLLEWYHAAPVLALAVLGACWLAFHRLGRAEVIT
jgi:ABC-2 type transport system permease protein